MKVGISYISISHPNTSSEWLEKFSRLEFHNPHTNQFVPGSSNFIDDDEDYSDLFYEEDSTPKTPEDIQNLFNRNPSSGPPRDPPGVSGKMGIRTL